MRSTPMHTLALSRTMRRATAVASVAAWDGCYGGAACDAANAPCCDCNMTEAECSAAGKEWLTDGSCTDICAEGTPVIWGCRSFQHGRGYVCDCSAKYGNDPAFKCAEKMSPWGYPGQWTNECKDKGDGCNALPSTELVALRAAPGPPLPPSQPPQPPSTPPSPSSPPDPPSPAPAPPQRCIPLVRHRRKNPPPGCPHADMCTHTNVNMTCWHLLPSRRHAHAHVELLTPPGRLFPAARAMQESMA